MGKIGENLYQVDSVEAKRVLDEYRDEILPMYEIALKYWNHCHEEHLSTSQIEQVLSEEYGDSAYEILYYVSLAETPQILFYLVSKIIEKKKIEQENRTLKEAISLMAKEREEANK